MAASTQKSIQKLSVKPGTAPSLDVAKKPVPVQEKVGFGTRQSGGGISSPLTETGYANREYYATFTVVSTDGLFTMEMRRIKKMQFVDAAGRAVEMAFSDKP